MKTTLLFASVTAVMIAVNSQAQPNNPIPGLTNIQTAPLASETIGVQQAALMQGARSFESSTLVDYSFLKSLFARAEAISATSGTGVDSLALGGGFYKSWTSARIYGVMEGRRNWSTHNWEGLGGIGIAYTPVQFGVLQNFSIAGEERIVISNLKSTPGEETLAGLRYSF